MLIDIIGAESLGVRGLCCLVYAGDRKILIDPGISLGFVRNGLAPHPSQVAVCEVIREKIKAAWQAATDIVFSHFHGDHVPLADANPYQLDIDAVARLNATARIWTKPPDRLSAKENTRYCHLKASLNANWQHQLPSQGPLCFSEPVPHGERTDRQVSVLMTRITDDTVFVHASDIQLLDNDTVDRILRWQPDILLADGPPLYLEQLSTRQKETAWRNALRLAASIDRPVFDHHLLRHAEGLEWIHRLGLASGRPVLCAADFMQTPRRLLEASRKTLYDTMPVPANWHADYARGASDTRDFRPNY